jgi:hypothetical protein
VPGFAAVMDHVPSAGAQPRMVLASTIGPVDAGIVAALDGFEVDRYGEPLFVPNSDDRRKRLGGAS